MTTSSMCDSKDLNIHFESGKNLDGNGLGVLAGTAIVNVFDVPNTITFGQDLLKGGHGHDELYGEGNSLNISLQGGTVDGAGNNRR